MANSRSKGALPPPERLTDDERKRLVSWIFEKYPRLVNGALEFEEACLDFHRSKGNLGADWLAAVRTWIRNEARGIYASPSRVVPQPARPAPPEYKPTATPEQIAGLKKRQEEWRKKNLP